MSETTTAATCPECGGEDREYGHQLACTRGLSPVHRAAEREFAHLFADGDEADDDTPLFEQTTARIAGPAGTSEVPAFVHPWCPGLAVTMANLGLFRVTHLASGYSLCPDRLVADACRIMVEWAAIGRAIGVDWESADKDELRARLKDHHDTPVPFGGAVALLDLDGATRPLTVHEWRDGMFGDDPPEWPIDDEGWKLLQTLAPADAEAP